MVSADEVREYNRECQAALNEANQALARRDVLEKELDNKLAELSKITGQAVTRENFEAVYKESTDRIERLVHNGRDLLARLKNEESGGAEMVNTVGNTDMLQSTPVQQSAAQAATQATQTTQQARPTAPNTNMPLFNNGGVSGVQNVQKPTANNFGAPSGFGSVPGAGMGNNPFGAFGSGVGAGQAPQVPQVSTPQASTPQAPQVRAPQTNNGGFGGVAGTTGATGQTAKPAATRPQMPQQAPGMNGFSLPFGTFAGTPNLSDFADDDDDPIGTPVSI